MNVCIYAIYNNIHIYNIIYIHIYIYTYIYIHIYTYDYYIRWQKLGTHPHRQPLMDINGYHVRAIGSSPGLRQVGRAQLGGVPLALQAHRVLPPGRIVWFRKVLHGFSFFLWIWTKNNKLEKQWRVAFLFEGDLEKTCWKRHETVLHCSRVVCPNHGQNG